MHLVWVYRLFAFVVGTEFCGSVVNGDVTVESGHTQGHNISVSSAHVNTGSFVDTEACYLVMEEAMKKTDHRKKMNLEEYLNFAIAYRPDGFVVEEDTVGDHPHGNISSTALEALLFDVLFVLVVHYYSPSYNKRLDDGYVGSKAGIDTTGSLVGRIVGETPTVSEQSYLFQVCTQTSNNDDNNSTTTTTTITEEEDRRVASIVGSLVVIVVIAVMIIAWCYVTRRNKNDDDDDDDAAAAVVLLQPKVGSGDHNTSEDNNDENVVVIVDTAIKITDVSNDNVMTNQMSLTLEQDGGGGGGDANDSLSSSSSSVMSSAGWSSSAGVDSMNTTTNTS